MDTLQRNDHFRETFVDVIVQKYLDDAKHFTHHEEYY